MAGSLSDMTSLLSSLQLQSTSAALSDGHAAQLTALQQSLRRQQRDARARVLATLAGRMKQQDGHIAPT